MGSGVVGEGVAGWLWVTDVLGCGLLGGGSDVGAGRGLIAGAARAF